MIHVILFQPEIPQNTGNIGRLCAITACRLHLIHPLGFKITDRQLKRSGMDYWKQLDVVHHEDWDSFWQFSERPKRLWLFTTKANKRFWDVSYSEEDGILFGNESKGCPQYIHEAIGDSQRVTIPHFSEGMRSINLSTCVGIATYEVLRQINQPGVLL